MVYKSEGAVNEAVGIIDNAYMYMHLLTFTYNATFLH